MDSDDEEMDLYVLYAFDQDLPSIDKLEISDIHFDNDDSNKDT